MLAMLAAAPVLAEEKNEAPRKVLVVQQPLFDPVAKREKKRGAPRVKPPFGLRAGDIITKYESTGGEIDFGRLAQDTSEDHLERLGDDNELKFLSDLMANLLSGNTAKLLAENEVELLSGNEFLSGNEVLSGNKAELFSGNSANFMSGNKFSLNINITESGNNSGNEGGEEEDDEDEQDDVSFTKIDRDHNGRVSLQEFRGKRKCKKARRRARKRFVKLDRNNDGALSIEEMR
jgi:hypothetical protein